VSGDPRHAVGRLQTAQAQTELPGKLVAQIPLPVEGWMDHISVDTRGQRLFVPAEQQLAIEVIDLRAGKVIHEITGFAGLPRKTVYLPGPNQIWVDDGETVKSFSGDTYALFKNIAAVRQGGQDDPRQRRL
jgi:hypothetical protein